MMMDSFRAYRTSKNHEKGVGWCLHIIHGNAFVGVKKHWFKDLMSLFSYLLMYPEGKLPKE
jgi:hypothetical protein